MKVSADRDAGRRQREFNVVLAPGTNDFMACALSADRIESPSAFVTVVRRAPTPQFTLHLLAVGINRYLNSRYNLNYGRPDAEAFVRLLTQHGRGIYRAIRTYEVHDADATRANVAARLADVADSASEDDVFVFYYAGHGVMSEGSPAVPPDFYLAFHDVTQLYGRDELLRERGLSAGELKEWCTRIPAQKQLLILDACQAGGAVDTFAFRGAAEQKAIAQLARSVGIIVLASSGTEQFASEFEELGHGGFTYALLEGMQGHADGGRRPDGKITVKELEAYIGDKVPEITRRFRGTPQFPNSYARGNDFPLVVP